MTKTEKNQIARIIKKLHEILATETHPAARKEIETNIQMWISRLQG